MPADPRKLIDSSDAPPTDAVGVVAARPAESHEALMARLYSGPREVFATGLAEANSLVNNRLTQRLSSRAGHVEVAA